VNLAELIAQYRILADDQAQGHLVSDAQLGYWFDEAQRQACMRARLIFEADDPSVCELVLSSATRSYALHEAVLEIERLFYVNSSGHKSRMGLVTRQWLERNYPHWMDDEVYPPRLAVQSDRALTVIGGLASGDVLRLECLRLPLDSLQNMADIPEIHAAHHPALVDWVLYRVYSIADTEKLNAIRGMDALARFTRHFGQAPTARLLRDTRMDTPQLTVPMP